MMAVRLGPLTDLFALVGPDALTRLLPPRRRVLRSGFLSFRHPRHWRNLSGPQARACRAREDRFDATDAIGGVTKSGLQRPQFEPVIPGRRPPENRVLRTK